MPTRRNPRFYCRFPLRWRRRARIPLAVHRQIRHQLMPILAQVQQASAKDLSPYQQSSTGPLAPHLSIQTDRGEKIPDDSGSVTSASHETSTGYIMGDVLLSAERAEELHKRFMDQYLPFLRPLFNQTQRPSCTGSLNCSSGQYVWQPRYQSQCRHFTTVSVFTY